MIIQNFQAVVLELNFGGKWPSRSKFGHPIYLSMSQSLTDFCALNVFPLSQGWPMYAQLLIDLFKYLAPFLRNVELNKPMQILYKVLA